MLRALLAAALLGAPGLALAGSPFPVDLGGPYRLVDQSGAERTEADPDGRAQLIFFGYANCLNICSAAFPLMAEVTRTLEAEGVLITPVLITIDPVQDSIDTIGPPLEAHHARFIGLTGDKEALSQAYTAFNVEFEPLFEDPEHGWIYSHTGFVHLVDGAGALLTLLPPVLNADQMTEIVRKYTSHSG